MRVEVEVEGEGKGGRWYGNYPVHPVRRHRRRLPHHRGHPNLAHQ